MQEKFSDHLRALGDSIWEAQRNHPFVRGVGDGTLEVERLKFWVRQDYLYLIDYSRVYNLAAAKAPGPELSGWLTFHADYTLNKEMALHQVLCPGLRDRGGGAGGGEEGPDVPGLHGLPG